jgi:hypothetical protein
MRRKNRPKRGAPVFSILLSDFRCFADPPPVEVRPITFLVGENSAGKTTFLAATRMILESMRQTSQNRFNRDPYFLGGFDEIAHFRGGVRGRARQFSVELISSAIPAPAGAPKARHRAEPPVPIRHKFTFAKGSPQPQLVEYEFSITDLSLIMCLGDTAVIKLIEKGKEIFRNEPKDRMPPVELMRRELTYLQYAFEILVFRVPSSPNETDAFADRPEIREKLTHLMHLFHASADFLSKDVFASAPVRTQPLRTYTPSEITPSAEGAHVPLEMARQKKSSAIDWGEIHDALVKFGKSSGLFDDINIRMLGKGDSDPFQITVKTGGPPMNIVDVGYGVSQALPIIYQLQQATQYDAFLLQQPEVHLHPRAQAELGTLIARISKQRPNTVHLIETHSDYIIDRVRMEIAAGRLDPKMVTIVFFDRQEHSVQPSNISLSDKGEIIDPPDNFRTFFLQEQQRLLGL